MVKNRFCSGLGNAVRDTRKHQNLTLARLAELAGVSVPSVRAIEAGDGYYETFLAVIAALGSEVTGRSLPTGDHIGERLALFRERQGLSQRDLAETADVSRPTIIAIERGEPGRLVAVEKVASVLGAGLCLVPQGEALSFYSAAGNSSTYHAWTTPADILERLYRVIDRPEFDLDPCSPTSNRKTAPVRSKVRFTAADDGLSLDWHGTVFVNPPYGRELGRWVQKCRGEVGAGRASCVIALVPARPDTAWWHENVADVGDVWMLRGRIAFGGTGSGTAPFPSAIVIWGTDPAIRERMATEFATSWHIPAWTCPRHCAVSAAR